MRRFANIFIILFVVDAVYSLIDELLIWFDIQMPLLTSARLLVAFIVLLWSVVLYACLGIDRRLPKRLFLPLTIYVAWCSLALWPLSGVISRDHLPLVASSGQVVMVFLIIVLQRGQLLLPEERFQDEYFSLGNTLGFTAINLLIAPIFLVGSALAVTGNYLEEQTAGFLRLSPAGIYMAERTYRLDEKEIRLAGMMHIGKQDYYRDLAESMSNRKTIILAEGVTDRDKLLKNAFNYQKVAGVLGLSSQETMQIDGNVMDLSDIDKPDRVRNEKPDIVRTDIDINQFESSTVDFLNMLGRTLFGSRPLDEALVEYNEWVNDHMTPETIEDVMGDILDKRNEVVIAGMQQVLNRYDTIIIPWGALHMPAIEEEVLRQGYAPEKEKERLSLDFSTLPYREMWRRFKSQPGHQAGAQNVRY